MTVLPPSDGHPHDRPATSSPDGRATALRLGPTGVWSAGLSGISIARARGVARALEAAGVTTLWISEGGTSREVLSHAAVLLSATDRLVVATGIANIHARDAQAAANGARTLGDAFPGRFVLGLGVSHQPRVLARGGDWRPPLATMVAYLDAMDRAAFGGPEPEVAVPMVLGALGPRMTQLGAQRTAGVHPYLVPVDHITRTRTDIGPGPVIAAELMVVLEEDAERARGAARLALAPYLALTNYRRNLLRLGYGSDDLEGGGSDRAIDTLVAWGGASHISARVDEFRTAGADHVCLQFLETEPEAIADGFLRIVGR